MTTVFADTCYWIAICNKRDALHPKARETVDSLWPCCIATTDEVLAEFLNWISGREPRLRGEAVKLTRAVLDNEKVVVLHQTRTSFLNALTLYEERPDKEYSLTDCAGMNAMKTLALSDALTDDHHFVQEGFVALLHDKGQ
jgi:predicted nucleic acid-binding protein